MQARLRQEFDSDRESVVAITDYATEQNVYEIHCRSCNKTLFADKESFKIYSHAIEQALDSPYVCDDCALNEAEVGEER